MNAQVIARPVRLEDIPALTKLDLRYDASRVLAISRQDTADGYMLSLQWTDRAAATELYNAYDDARLRGAIDRVDLLLVALLEAAPVGLRMVMRRQWTDSDEVTDLPGDAADRRCGAGGALG